MSFLQLVYFMLGMIKESTQNALERYFERIGKDTFMSQQAFSEARQKIKWEAFREMFDFTVSTYYTNNPIQRWHGLRVFAVDGSKFSLPNDTLLLAHFGGLGPDKQSPTAQGSALYDVLNGLVVDARLEPIAVGEQALARLHIDHLQGMASFEEWRELVIFDRGYASIELVRGLLARKIHYVMRVRSKFSTAIDALGCGDHTIELGHGEGRVPVRVIKFRLSSGEIETLITDLVDTKYGMKTFKALYFKRWPIETKYNQLKNKLEIENFSGRLVDNIRQDFFATMVMTNLAADFFWEAQAVVDKEQKKKKNKHRYKINVNHEIGVLKDLLIKTMLEDDDAKRGQMFDKIMYLLTKRLTTIRPNRSIPRTIPRKAKFHHNHKSNC